MASDPPSTFPEINPYQGNFLEVDHSDDTDSAYGETDSESNLTSISSSILKYREENGRTYHAYKETNNYPLPNDEVENDRLDLQHQLFLLTLKNKLSLAPIKPNPPRVLDVGTGTGIWALDFADDNPGSQIIGNDLSAIQPSFVPPNLQFIVDDVEEAWTYNYKFDLIHARMMVGSLKDWPRFFRQCFDNLAPGGYLELQDMSFPALADDGSMKGTKLEEWCQLIEKACSQTGSSTEEPYKYARHMQETGYSNVREVRYKWPINAWPKGRADKELGAWAMQNFLDGLQGFSIALMTRVLHWTPEEVEVLVAHVRNDLRNRRIHGYWVIHVVYGQKPHQTAQPEPESEQPTLERPVDPQA